MKKTISAIALSLGMAAASNAALTVATNITDDGSVEFGNEGASDGNAGSGSDLSLVWVTLENDLTAAITFELNSGADVQVDGIAFWNYTPWATNNGVQDATIEFFDGGVSQGILNFTATQEATINVTATQQDFSLTSSVVADTAILTLGGGAANYGGNRVGFNEIQFDTSVAAVPEPSSTALLGLGGLALIMRRRK